MNSSRSGWGKIILFNEHFVVYNIPAIACAINSKIHAQIKTPISEKENSNFPLKVISKMVKTLELPKNLNLDVTLKGNLPHYAGLGSSAASCVAIARALSSHFKLNLNDKQINNIAFEGEKMFHENPSGIDNTVATYGKTIWFTKSKVEEIRLQKPLRIVIGHTNIHKNTKEAIIKVKNWKRKNPILCKEIFKTAKDLAYAAKKSLEKFDLEKLGLLMYENHTLLQKIGISCIELDKLVEAAKENGALGAKMTGGGLGGSMIALTPERKLQENIFNTIKKMGFNATKTTIGESQ